MHAFPGIVVAAPRCHAVDVGGDLCAGQGQKLFPGQFKRILHLPVIFSFQSAGKPFGRAFVAQHWPLLGQVLSGWEAILPIGKFFYFCS